MSEWDMTDTWGAEPDKPAKPSKRSKAEPEKRTWERAVAIQLSLKYLYRRAFSEIQLMEALRGMEMTEGTAINVITGGDIDQMSYLAYFVRRYAVRDLYISTWCMSAEDARQLMDWMDNLRITRCRLYVGEIFKSSYSLIYSQLVDYFNEHPEKGDISIFRCHAKIIAARTDKFSFSVQGSANMDTNPRTEQACIQISEDSYNFYKSYFDGIISFDNAQRR